MSHTCQALIFRCMDFRIAPEDLSKLLAKIGYLKNSYDTVSVAGAGKDLISANAGESDMLLKQIELSQKLHCINEVIILYHDNCGAYGIADAAEERNAQCIDLDKIKSLLAAKFSGLNITTFIIEGTTTSELKLTSV